MDIKMEKKKLAASGIVILSVLCFCYVLYRKADDLYFLVHDYQDTRTNEKEYWSRHEKKADMASFYTLRDEEGAWYTKYHFISLAGGGISGKTGTGSREAWEHSYELGSRVMEADFWTDESKIPDVHAPYEPMSCEEIVEFMDRHPDLYVVFDMGEECREKSQYLVNMSLCKDAKDVLERMIIGFYDFENLDEIRSVYPFSNLLLKQHEGREKNYYEIAEFCLENEIHAVHAAQHYLDDEGIQMLAGLGVHIYAETDFISDMKYYYRKGIFGAVTSWLYESDWDLYIEREDGT